MRKCPKCSREYADTSSICRTCGAILDTVETPGAMEAGPPPLDSVQSRPLKQATSARVSPWTCLRCRESVPDTFDVCWNCGTNREGMEDPDFQKEPSEDDSGIPRTFAGPRESLAEAPRRYQCPKCGSSKIIPEARVVDQGEYSNGHLCVEICGAPDAVIFKDRLRGHLTAIICGECGHVELQVENPHALYEKYRQSLGDES